MKKSVLAILAVLMILLAGCGKSSMTINNGVVGKWAYNHDPKITIAEFKDNGKAVYLGHKYTYSADNDFVILSDGKSGDIKLRYSLTEKGMDLCKNQIYSRVEEGKGLTGYWLDSQNNFTFEFTENGTFREDGSFTGYYTVNEDEGTIKLVYEQYFEDTLLHYQLSDSKLVIEYPWPMVRTEK